MIVPAGAAIAVPPTVGFLVQVIKGTALASVIGFVELTKAGTHDQQRHLQALRRVRAVALMYFAAVLPDLGLGQASSKGN